MVKDHFQMHFHHQLVMNFKKMKNSTNPSGKNAFLSMAETAQQLSLWVFDNSSLVHVSIKDLAVRRMYPASILRKSTSGRHRPVSYPDGPMTARYRFT